MWHALFHNDEIIIKLRSERKEERTNREMMIESLLFDCSLTAQIWLWNCVCACVFMFLCKHCPASNNIGCKQQQQHSVMAATKSKCVNALTIFIWYHKRDTIFHAYCVSVSVCCALAQLCMGMSLCQSTCRSPCIHIHLVLGLNVRASSNGTL